MIKNADWFTFKVDNGSTKRGRVLLLLCNCLDNGGTQDGFRCLIVCHAVRESLCNGLVLWQFSHLFDQK
jgi:hypothetical protein